eukprot:TRINITY_DN40270_c0_g1_i1.p1 TRINITY_DN40270_c0_g1~~TRINITY_DN40270_c0_g1_i1.p1  ORF type:complete len:429 (-),score=95.35 TRINITY_DN40270_c0_g1_i1:153-1439(-)
MSFAKETLEVNRATDNTVGRLVFKAVRANNVLACDVNGKSDPYAVITVGDQQYKTSTQMKTLNPEWNEDFTFHVSVGKELKLLGTELVVNLWDWDKVGSDDFLGMHKIALTDLKLGEKVCRTVELLNRKNVAGKKMRGTLTYEATLYPETEWGQSLDKLVRRASRTGRGVPYLVEACVSYLEEHGLHTEGLFRIPGNRSLILQLKDHFETGAEDVPADSDVHAVGGVLKLFLRDLPEPLMSFALYQEFVDSSDDVKVAKDDDVRNERLKAVLAKVEPSLSSLLKHLVLFLYKVSTHSGSNKMSAHNLAIVFAPNLLRAADCDTNVTRVLTDQNKCTACIARLIEFAPMLFGVDDAQEVTPAPAPTAPTPVAGGDDLPPPPPPPLTQDASDADKDDDSPDIPPPPLPPKPADIPAMPEVLPPPPPPPNA